MSSTPIKTKPSVFLLFGPTAVGKTEILFRRFGADFEIISADSMQVYRGFDIGTAKPSPEERKAIPHHLIDICSPEEQFSAGQFTREAENLIPRILARGKIPVLSGGTAFYLKNFIFGTEELPPQPPDSSIRDYLNSRADKGELVTLYRELQVYDPKTAERLAPGDRARIIRALEVFQTTGKPLSSWQPTSTKREDYSLILIGLDRERSELYHRIDQRVVAMFKTGLENEVKSLLSGQISPACPAMQSIGYREFVEWKTDGCLTRKGLIEKISRNSRNYAKRQLTFFRSFKDVNWFNLSETTRESALEELIYQKRG